jgi:hypothetical protein
VGQYFGSNLVAQSLLGVLYPSSPFVVSLHLPFWSISGFQLRLLEILLAHCLLIVVKELCAMFLNYGILLVLLCLCVFMLLSLFLPHIQMN